MFKWEVAKELTCEQYGAFVKTTMPVAHALPDGRMVLWFHERDVHEFMVAWDATHPLAGPEQLELELGECNGIIEPTAVPVHACFILSNNADKLDGTGSEDSGTQPGTGNTEEVPK